MDIREKLDLAIQHHQAGRWEQAERLYREILEAAPNHAEALLLLGALACQAGEYEIAMELIEQSIRVDPGRAEAHFHLGNVFKRQGRPEEAESAYRRAVAFCPDAAEAHYNLALALVDLGRADEATESYRRAIALNPNDADAHYNLANILEWQGQPEAAVDSYRRALEIDPGYARAHNNLGISLKNLGRLEEAIGAYRRALEIDPGYAQAHNNLGVARAEQGKADEAVGCFRKAIELDPGYVDPHKNLGGIFGNLSRTDEAVAVYRRVVELEPADAAAKHMLAALTGQTTETAPLEYVKNLFDQHAAKFEFQLVDELGYKSPEALRRAVDEHFGGKAHFGNALDLGCGTGLLGEAFRTIVDRLSGIDIAPRMIEIARKKNIYAALHLGEIVGFLKETPEKFDLFLATDVFVYLGKLEPVFDALRNCASSGAYVLFATESCDEADYVLRPTGRYAQSRPYIQSLADKYGYAIELCRESDVRKEKDQYIPGDLFILKYTGVSK